MWWPVARDAWNGWYTKSGTILTLGGYTGEAWGPALSAIDAFIIESKIDDGYPNTGFMVAHNAYSTATAGWYPSGCTNVAATAYDMTQTVPYCVVGFVLDY